MSARVEFFDRDREVEEGPAGATYTVHKTDYYFRVRGGNGEPLMTSEAYTTQTDARRGFLDPVDAVIAAKSGMAR